MKKINRKHLRNLILKEMRNLTTEQLEDPKESEFDERDLQKALFAALFNMFQEAQPMHDAAKWGAPEEIDRVVGSGAYEVFLKFIKKDPIWSRWYQSLIDKVETKQR